MRTVKTFPLGDFLKDRVAATLGAPSPSPDFDEELARMLEEYPAKSAEYRATAFRNWQMQVALRAQQENEGILKKIAAFRSLPKDTAEQVESARQFVTAIMNDLAVKENAYKRESENWTKTFKLPDEEGDRLLKFFSRIRSDIINVFVILNNLDELRKKNDEKKINQSLKNFEQSSKWAFFPDPNDPITRKLNADRIATDRAMNWFIGNTTILVQP